MTNYFKFDDRDFELKQELEKEGIRTFLNLELRLPYLNNNLECCDLHVIFSDKVADKDIKTFLSNLALKIDNKEVKAIALLSKEDFEKATIEFDTLQKELESKSLNLQEKYLIGSLSRGHGNSRSSRLYKSIQNKSDFIIHSSDNPKNVEKDRKYWLGLDEDKPNKVLPLLQSSDAHCLDDIGKNITWIKSDPTYEGLKQILHEPEDRVKIENNKPSEKEGYKVISSISFKCDDFLQQPIVFNPNLNVIIGGRSAGKSTLLKVMASKIKTNNTENIEDYIQEYLKNVTIEWGDEEKDTDRDIDYFGQNYMNDIAKDENKRNELIDQIVKEKKSTREKLHNHEESIESNQKKIQQRIKNLFALQEKVKNKQKELKEKGDAKGINHAINSFEKDIKLLHRDKLSHEEIELFNKISNEIDNERNFIQNSENDIQIINKLENITLFNNDLEYQFSELLFDNREKIKKILDSIKNDITKSWKRELNKKIEEIKQSIEKKNKDIKEKEANCTFKKGIRHLNNDKQLRELNNKLNKEKIKLNEITKIKESIEIIEDDKKKLFQEILYLHCEYKTKVDELIREYSLKHEDIEIKIIKKFEKEQFENLLKDFINLQGQVRKNFIEKFISKYENDNTIKSAIKNFVEEGLYEKITLKHYKSHEETNKTSIRKKLVFYFIPINLSK